MMFNRALQVRMVKHDKNIGPIDPDNTNMQTIVSVQEASRAVLKEVKKIVIAYVVGDTIRKVLVELVNKS